MTDAASQLSAVFDKLRAQKPLSKDDAFPVKTRKHLTKRAATGRGNRLHAARSARNARLCKSMIRPENAAAVVAELPEPGEALHAVIAGDFIFCDLFPAMVARVGPLLRLDVATLSLSVANVQTLKELVSPSVPFHLLLSHFFRGSNQSIWLAVKEVLEVLPAVRVSVARTHCKVAVLEFANAIYVFEGSANLRSSRNLEQFTLWNCPDLAEFHRGWMEEAARNQC